MTPDNKPAAPAQDEIDAARYRHLKSKAYWDDERDFGPGGRWWLAVLVADGRPNFDDAVDADIARTTGA